MSQSNEIAQNDNENIDSKIVAGSQQCFSM